MEDPTKFCSHTQDEETSDCPASYVITGKKVCALECLPSNNEDRKIKAAYQKLAAECKAWINEKFPGETCPNIEAALN